MLKRKLAMLAIVCITAGCTQSSEQLGGKTNTQLTSGDNSFFKAIAISNQTEIQSSELAMTQSHSQSIKDFAQKMIDDHTSAGGQVATLAMAKGVMLPTAMDTTHQMMVDNIRSKSGPEFDRAYLDLQVGAHKETITLDEDEANNGTDPDVKQLANKLLDTLKMHLDMAQKLQSGQAAM